MTWFYMSFVDPERPAGDRFVGGCYVQGASMPEALDRSWRLGINPGGEVKILELPDDKFDALVPEGDRERLLSREEVEA